MLILGTSRGEYGFHNVHVAFKEDTGHIASQRSPELLTSVCCAIAGL